MVCLLNKFCLVFNIFLSKQITGKKDISFDIFMLKNATWGLAVLQYELAIGKDLHRGRIIILSYMHIFVWTMYEAKDTFLLIWKREEMIFVGINTMHTSGTKIIGWSFKITLLFLCYLYGIMLHSCVLFCFYYI